ncbi:hypothetical protein M9H77_07785 [Catharanthus roseus]|uniref:Uncharacterized protein n=1 Tax=Catharanthus roseus TaxID=4058 RepID=A0ACC0BVW8_CATRO|nr:hypothetical protein M9H77_07785 [Catharanthus roseus]
MGVRLFGNRALVWCLAGIDYEMPKLGFDGLKSLQRTHTRGLTECSRSRFSISCLLLRLTQDGQGYNKPLNLLSRGTQISYSAAVDPVAELGDNASQDNLDPIKS